MNAYLGEKVLDGAHDDALGRRDELSEILVSEFHGLGRRRREQQR